MLSPSFTRGVDLPDDKCRCIIIAKVPFPYLGDPQIAKRVKEPNGNWWYSLQAVQAMIQMTGRGVRHEKDYCTTYILDKQFSRLRGRMLKVFPKWWLEAIKENDETNQNI